jgi:chemotaxis protein CheX
MNTLKSELIDALVAGAVETLQIQCSATIKPGTPFPKNQQVESRPTLASVIDVNSPTIRGSVVLRFPETVFLAIMGRMLGEPFTQITDDIQDGACELLNVIFGHAKMTLNERGHSIEKAIPCILGGMKAELIGFQLSEVLVVPFESDLGAFQLEIAPPALH